MKNKLLWSLLLFLALISTVQARYPSQPITLVVPYPRGGSSTPLATAVSDRMAATLGQQVIIEHIAGGAGTIAAMRVKESRPDGHTVLVAAMGTHVTSTVLQDGLPYDPVEDFDLLALAVRVPVVLIVNPGVPAQNIGEFTHWLKRHPKTVFAASGVGSMGRLLTELFWQRTGTTGTLAHYKGEGPSVADVIDGEVQAALVHLGAVLPSIKAGKVKALAVSSEKRWAALPEVPTMQEAGIDVVIHSWHGFAAPKGLAPEVKATLQNALLDALQVPAIREALESDGFEVVAGSPDTFAQLIRTQTAQLRAIHRELEAGKR